MSHVKNVEAFGKLVGICTGYGEQYNPGQPNLQVESLTNLLEQARCVLLNVSVAKTGFENATNNREVAFDEIDKLASRILAELKSTDALQQTVADARAMVRKIKGHRSIVNRPALSSEKSVQPAEPTPVRTRINGTDFASIVYHFEKLLQTLANEPLYQPTVADLQVAILQEKLNNLRTQNASVITTATELGKARRERNAMLYNRQGSLHSTAMAVKQQVRAVFGYNNEAVRAASSIRFNKTNVK